MSAFDSNSSNRLRTVYAIVRPSDPSIVVYVGSSVDPVERLKEHRGHGSYLLREWLGISPDAVALELERGIPPERTLEREGWWYDRFMEVGMPLLNWASPKRVGPYEPPTFNGERIYSDSQLEPLGLVLYERRLLDKGRREQAA